MSMILIHKRRKGLSTITNTYVTNIIMKDDTGPDMISGRTLLIIIMYLIFTRWLGPTPTKGTKWYWYTSTQDGVFHIRIIYNTVHKGTSKRHITDEKTTHFAVRVPPSIFDLLKIHYTQQRFKELLPHYNQHHFKDVVGYRLNLFINIDQETCTTISSGFWGLFPTPKWTYLTFYINIGIPLKTLLQNLVYYYLHHE